MSTAIAPSSPVGSGTERDRPSRPASVSLEQRITYTWAAGAFAGGYTVRAAENRPSSDLADEILMAEGYRMQGHEALWFAESTLAVGAEVLPSED